MHIMAVCRCIFNAGTSKLPDIESEDIKNVKKKDLAINVYCNGQWGTYRHLPLEINGTLKSEIFAYKI